MRQRSGWESAVPSEGWGFSGLDGRVAGLSGGVSCLECGFAGLAGAVAGLARSIPS